LTAANHFKMLSNYDFVKGHSTKCISAGAHRVQITQKIYSTNVRKKY